jgi:hypothetical protein
VNQPGEPGNSQFPELRVIQNVNEKQPEEKQHRAKLPESSHCGHDLFPFRFVPQS